MKRLAILILLTCMTACQAQDRKKEDKAASTAEEVNSQFKVSKSDAEWKAELTPDQYYVLRHKETERPFTGEYYKHFEDGVYVCAACGNPLFKSDAKFDSECGWPSFDQAIKGSVIEEEDNSHGMHRTEVMCANCGGHLGHVFDDGPKDTTGERFCTNSVSIKFIAAKEIKKNQ